MNISTKSLRCFLSLATTASFSATAQEQNVTQSAVSQLISKMEEGFGKKLFLRKQGRNQKIELTKAGKLLKKRAAIMVEHAEKMVNEIDKCEAEELAAA